MPDRADASTQMAERKLIELREKLAGVGAEFDRWLEDTEEGRPLRKHRSQIERLTEQLRGLVERVQQEIDGAAGNDDVLAACLEVQLRILEVHRLWDYFRSKLNLRYVEWFRRYLLLADEFAWACYKPAQDSVDGAPAELPAIKAAPLVFLSGEFSPFTHPRQQPYKVEDVDDALNSMEFLQVAFKLPVPVIGLPWYQVSHLPDVVLVAHEVGHDVERDFGLTATLEEHLAAATEDVPAERSDGWFAWLPEVFADLYGVLAAGPPYASALADLLATDPVRVVAESAVTPPWMRHPPASIRLAIAARALVRTGFADEAAAQWKAWNETFRPDPEAPFAGDVDAVVDGLLGGRYPQFGDRKLPQVIFFSSDQQQAAAAAATSILETMEPDTGDIRSLVGAARLAFDQNPEGYQADHPEAISSQELILERAEQVIDDEPRREEEQLRPTPTQDREAGKVLFDLITGIKAARRTR